MVTKDASSKILGFLYQMQRALYRIFSCETNNTVIGIETADDVVEEIRSENENWQVFFEQDKHSIQNNHQPYQDSSYNLWHTLHIWLFFIEEAREKYEKITYCLVSNKTIKKDNLAYILSQAKSDQEIDAALARLKEKGKAIYNGLKDSSEIKKTIGEVLKYQDENLKFLIKNITLLSEDGTKSTQDPKSATINLLHIPSELIQESENIYKSVFAHMVNECICAWKQKQSVQLIPQTYKNLLYNEILARKKNRFCEQSRNKTAYQEYLKKDIDKKHLFIDQLCSINKSEEHINRALKNYWAFYSEKVRLESIGDIPLDAWQEREDILYQRWENEWTKYDLSNVTEDEKIFQYEKIYDSTTDINYLADLNNNPTKQPYFTQGHYHFLANDNTNEFYIYWHDKFKKNEEF